MAKTKDNWTLANLVSISRIILTPFFLICLIYQFYLPAFLFFIACAATDLADGIIARIGGQNTQMGAILDPLADKFMMAPTYLIFAFLGLIPVWLFILIASRDLLIILGWLIQLFYERTLKIRSRFSGKIAVGAQMILFMAILAAQAFPNLFEHVMLGWYVFGYLIIAVLTLFSFLDYVVTGSRHLIRLSETAQRQV